MTHLVSFSITHGDITIKRNFTTTSFQPYPGLYLKGYLKDESKIKLKIDSVTWNHEYNYECILTASTEKDFNEEELKEIYGPNWSFSNNKKYVSYSKSCKTFLAKDGTWKTKPHITSSTIKIFDTLASCASDESVVELTQELLDELDKKQWVIKAIPRHHHIDAHYLHANGGWYLYNSKLQLRFFDIKASAEAQTLPQNVCFTYEVVEFCAEQHLPPPPAESYAENLIRKNNIFSTFDVKEELPSLTTEEKFAIEVIVRDINIKYYYNNGIWIQNDIFAAHHYDKKGAESALAKIHKFPQYSSMEIVPVPNKKHPKYIVSYSNENCSKRFLTKRGIWVIQWDKDWDVNKKEIRIFSDKNEINPCYLTTVYEIHCLDNVEEFLNLPCPEEWVICWQKNNFLDEQGCWVKEKYKAKKFATKELADKYKTDFPLPSAYITIEKL